MSARLTRRSASPGAGWSVPIPTAPGRRNALGRSHLPSVNRGDTAKAKRTDNPCQREALLSQAAHACQFITKSAAQTERERQAPGCTATWYYSASPAGPAEHCRIDPNFDQSGASRATLSLDGRSRGRAARSTARPEEATGSTTSGAVRGRLPHRIIVQLAATASMAALVGRRARSAAPS